MTSSIVSTALRGALWCGVAAVLGAGVAGCGDDDPCEVFCARSVECDANAPTEEQCVALCEELSKDQAYADALEEQVDCYEEESCERIALGGCAPDYS